jgi:hypothetical protein
MDATTVDRLRRALGPVTSRRPVLPLLGAAGLTAALQLGGPDATAKHRHHHKHQRCKTLGASCSPGGQRHCCHALHCAPVSQPARLGGDGVETFCCKTDGGACRPDHTDCCVPFGCNPETHQCQFA